MMGGYFIRQSFSSGLLKWKMIEPESRQLLLYFKFQKTKENDVVFRL